MLVACHTCLHLLACDCPYSYVFARILTLLFICFARMSSAYDLYNGTARNKRKAKVARETSQPTPKKTRTEELVVETSAAVPEVEVVETPPHRVSSPLVEVFEESGVDVPLAPSPVDEPVVGSTSKEARQELFDRVARMTAERVEKVHQKNN